MKKTELPKKAIEEEYALAKKEKRQPLCPYCKNPLEVFQEWTRTLFYHWTWNETEKIFRFEEVDKGGQAEDFQCENCGFRSDSFYDGDLIQYIDSQKKNYN